MRRCCRETAALLPRLRRLAGRPRPRALSPRAGAMECERALETIKEFAPNSATAAYLPLRVDGVPLGYLAPPFAEQLCKSFGHVFEAVAGGVQLCTALDTVESRTAAVAACCADLASAGLIKGWRGELLPVAASFNGDPVFLIERAAAPYFGIRAYGVHVNCFVSGPSGGVSALWVARRSAKKQTWPRALDHMVAGGQPHGISPSDNVVKEAGEEAGVPPALARCAIAAGVVSYEVIVAEGLKRDVLFCYGACLMRLHLSADWDVFACADPLAPSRANER